MQCESLIDGKEKNFKKYKLFYKCFKILIKVLQLWVGGWVGVSVGGGEWVFDGILDSHIC